MSRKHLKKYFQKYHIIFASATAILLLYACSTTKKVPDGEYLLTKNKFHYEDVKLFEDEVESSVQQKPNKKTLFLFPVGLWVYNLSNPKYDSLFTEYMTYPSEMRDQRLRDSLLIKYGKNEDVGKSLWGERVLHTLGKPPVILDQGKSETSANNIEKTLTYRGYWEAEVDFDHKLDSAAKKAEVNYYIENNDPTMISEYYYDIPYPSVKAIYEEDLSKSLVRSKAILDQTVLEDEVKRVTELMRSRGYYRFNNANDEIYFTADTLTSTKQVPLTMEIRKDTLNTPYKVATVGNIKMFIVDDLSDTLNVKKDSLRGITFFKQNDRFKTRAMWRPVILQPGRVYDQHNFDLTKRNISAMNNFSLARYKEGLRKGSDSIIDVTYYLSPLNRYDLKLAFDANYSQLLNLSAAPSVDLLSRNIFGGAENLSTSVSWIVGSIRSSKDENKRVLAHELSAQASLMFPRLLLPFSYYKVIPKRYSPTSSIILGASYQKNIGMDRLTFNTGLNYFANVNDVVQHRLTLFNTQLSLTGNKDRYYEFFPRDQIYRDLIFQDYSPALNQQFQNGQLDLDEYASMIINDQNYVNSLSGSTLDGFNSFRQSLLNRDRQTQDVLVASMQYGFTYNEIGKKEFENPFFFSGKFELAGNIVSLLGKTNENRTAMEGDRKEIFNIPYSQFVKFDFDVRKYFSFGRQNLVLRQFIGLGIPYGNSTTMPYIKSYFNGGSLDIRAWNVFGGLGPADSQLDERIRAYAMDNVKLTTNIEYRIPFTDMYEGAVFTDMGNIWSLKDNGFGDQFKFSEFYKQLGIGSGVGLRIHVAYITARIDLAYKIYDPNRPVNERWRLNKFQPLKPTLNFALGYPF